LSLLRESSYCTFLIAIIGVTAVSEEDRGYAV
jgi:hypothetical protein